MYYSAKSGLAIACRLSVRLSVMLVDHDHIQGVSKVSGQLWSVLAFLVFGAQTSRKAVREANLAENSKIIVIK